MCSATKKNAILSAWEETLAEKARKPAILSPDGEVRRTFTAIEEESAVWEERLAEVPPGSILAIQIGNSFSWPALLLAAFRRSLIPLPLGRHIEKAEREQVFDSVGVSALVESTREMEGGEELIRITLQKVPIPQSALGCDFLKVTSGTTSLPRAIRFTADQLLADCVNICETMGISDGDLNFGVIPFSHSYGFSNLLTPLLCRGIPLVASDDRMPRAILEGLRITKASVFPGMPVFFDKLAGIGSIPGLESLRLCISAGAPLTKAVGGAFTREFGLKIHTFYGASECGGMCYDGSEELVYQEALLGQPMRNVQVEAMEDGVISIRSQAVGEGYFPQPEPATLGDGRFIPSDLVRKTEAGMILVGRSSDVINVAGRKLNPLEVESQLLAFPGVRQAVVFGIPSSLRNEEAVACIGGNIDQDAFLQFAQERLSSWQLPRDFWFVEEIPANERGKISRRELASRYQQLQSKR